MFLKQSFAEDDFVTYVGEGSSSNKYIYKIHIGDCVVQTVVNYDGGIGFNIPLYRWIYRDAMATRVTGGVVIRASNNAGTGIYIVKGSSGGSNPSNIDTDDITSCSFYNGANQLTYYTYGYGTIADGSVELRLLVDGDYPFSGNATNFSRIEKNACTVWLSNIDVYVEVSS